jgi:hypothetical protein
VALKCSPSALIFEPTALTRRTVTTVPAGRATCLPPDVDVNDVAEASVCSPAGLVEQATDTKRRGSKKLYRAKHLFIFIDTS